MHRPPAVRPARAPVLVAAVLLPAVTACSGIAPGPAASPAPTPPPSAQSPATLPTPATAPTLTAAQARAALITEADLGEPWQPTRGAATWRDQRLKATTEGRDCRRLLDVLYTEDLFGAAPAPRATVGLDDTTEETQLHYRVTAHRAADVDRALAWLRALPDRCGRFPARTAEGDAQDVRVTGLDLPEAGDARAALRVTLRGPAAGVESAVLTVVLAAARVGDDAISLTYGGLGEVWDDVAWTAVEVGARRLAEVRRQGRALV
ncbi:hypothetical protein ACLGIH_16170 [Streptomyces sp. HMX87]|uniref:hypothetical protein n=1 Tax=Streptomyces sp. HMX87 TaxID=3390849 RepID=UPI003A872A46